MPAVRPSELSCAPGVQSQAVDFTSLSSGVFTGPSFSGSPSNNEMQNQTASFFRGENKLDEASYLDFPPEGLKVRGALNPGLADMLSIHVRLKCTDCINLPAPNQAKSVQALSRVLDFIFQGSLVRGVQRHGRLSRVRAIHTAGGALVRVSLCVCERGVVVTHKACLRTIPPAPVPVFTLMIPLTSRRRWWEGEQGRYGGMRLWLRWDGEYEAWVLLVVVQDALPLRNRGRTRRPLYEQRRRISDSGGHQNPEWRALILRARHCGQATTVRVRFVKNISGALGDADGVDMAGREVRRGALDRIESALFYPFTRGRGRTVAGCASHIDRWVPWSESCFEVFAG
ncbi:hypothetical protein C8R46DRAFT_1321652 [Mycena filopes]|nr:hypothetical protein C8R46DRAFT_1321652 [Mycena filopes]